MEWFKGRAVVITGGSTGIGAAFARRLTEAGADVALVARGAGRLAATARALRQASPVRVETVVQDLSAPGAAAQVAQALEERGFAPDVLINNAGFASHGPFHAQALTPQLEQLQLNVTALVELTWRLLPGLLARRGGLIQVASTAAFQPLPYMALYGASKAFVLSFSEALWAEYRGQGLKVLALCPGATDTPFFERVGAAEASVGARASPDAVVDVGLKAFLANRPSVVPGVVNRLGTLAPRFVTRAQAALLTERLLRPRGPALPVNATTSRAGPW